MWIGGDGEDKKEKGDQDHENQKPHRGKNRKRIEGKGGLKERRKPWGFVCGSSLIKRECVCGRRVMRKSKNER